MKKNKSIIAAVVVVVVLVLALAVTSKAVSHIEKESCFTTLMEYASQIVSEVNGTLSDEQKSLKRIAQGIARSNSVYSEKVKTILSSFEEAGLASRIELLLPGDEVLGGDGKLSDTAGILSFEEEASKGAHISGRMKDFGRDEWILRNFVPVEKNGVTIGMLYGVIELEHLAKLYDVDAYDGNAQVFMIDGKTGDFFVDSWHETLENTEDFQKHKAKKGYSKEKMISDLAEGVSGTTVFLSDQAKDYFYIYYEPVGINHWMLLLTVPEKVAFQRVRNIMLVAYYLAVFELIVFVLYFIWIITVVRKENREKERQLGRVNYMFSVQKILFDSYNKPNSVREALKKVAETMEMDQSFLILKKEDKIVRKFLWNGNATETDDEEGNLPESLFLAPCRFSLEEPEGQLFYDLGWIREKEPEVYHELRNLGIHSILVYLIIGLDRDLTGYLGVADYKRSQVDIDQLECVSLSFSMAIRNMQSYNAMKQMGIMDRLTGVLNRNCYHEALAMIDQNDYHSLACIYMDANGLHDINNHLGHEEGDRMLQVTAAAIREVFGFEDTYRIGGDEFVALCRDWEEDEVIRGAEAVTDKIEKEHFEISAGIEWRDHDLNISAIVKSAEELMQQNKRRYYRQKGDVRKSRELNRKLEKILSEKRDADVFLSVIAPGFKGVYFVNLTTDTVRHIFIPDYFEKMLAKTEGKFSEAIFLYASEIVEERDYGQFCEFCDYQAVEKQLNQETVPELTYQRKDGSYLKLQIFKFKKYSETDKETLWVFEDIHQTGENELL